MGKCECGRLKGNPCGPLRPNTINVTMPRIGGTGGKFMAVRFTSRTAPRRIDTTENSRLLKPSQETTVPSNGTVLELNI